LAPGLIPIRIVHPGMGDVSPREIAQGTTMNEFLLAHSITLGSESCCRVHGVERGGDYVLQSGDSICISPRNVKANE
jgi:hypothetical protein